MTKTTQTTLSKIINRCFIRLVWFPFGFPFFMFGALVGYAQDAFKSGYEFYTKAIDEECETS